MLLQSWSISSSTALHNSWAFSYSGKHHNLVFKGPICLRKPKASSPTCLRAQLLEEITQLAHNKVLIAAGVSAAIGQLTKPVTSVILYGKDFDFKAIVQAGGFPSTHSSAVVATATTLGLERGLSDSIFGLTVVYAGLVMYDAQAWLQSVCMRHVWSRRLTVGYVWMPRSLAGAQGAQPPGSQTATTYKSIPGGENKSKTELKSRQDQGGVQVDKLQDKVEDAAGKGGPVFGSGKDPNKQDLGVTGSG